MLHVLKGKESMLFWNASIVCAPAECATRTAPPFNPTERKQRYNLLNTKHRSKAILSLHHFPTRVAYPLFSQKNITKRLSCAADRKPKANRFYEQR